MYVITQRQWESIPDGYKEEHSITHGRKSCFLGCIKPGGGTTLIFEGLHFIVLPTRETTGDDEKDRILCEMLEQLTDATPEQREAWENECKPLYNERPYMAAIVPLAVKIAGDLAEYEKALQ